MHCRFFKIIILLGFSLLFTTRTVCAQALLDSTGLEEAFTYFDLAEALKNPEQVVKLELRKKKYKEFPKEIFQFKNLQYLDIGKNQIKELPDSICVFRNLQHLNVSRNKLTVLPKEIGKLGNLIYLCANNNELISLPPQIGNLSKLQVIDVWSNEFSDYPETLSELKNLKTFDVRATMITPENIALLQRLMPQAYVHYDLPCNCK